MRGEFHRRSTCLACYQSQKPAELFATGFAGASSEMSGVCSALAEPVAHTENPAFAAMLNNYLTERLWHSARDTGEIRELFLNNS